MVPEHYVHEVRFNPSDRRGGMNLLFCGRGKPAEGHKIGPTVHDYCLVHTVRAGRGVFTIGGQRYECTAGDTFVIVPGELFSYEADAREPWEYAWVAFTGTEALDQLRRIGVAAERPVVRGAGRAVFACCRNIMAILDRPDLPDLADLACAGYLRLLLHGLGQRNRAHLPDEGAVPSDTERRVRYAANYLKTQFAQPISIEKLADESGYRRTYFSQVFRQHVGRSPKQYLFEVRMEQAETLLAATALTVEQVAASVGYGDPLYFSKQFRRWSGMAPSAYRKRKLEALRGRAIE